MVRSELYIGNLNRDVTSRDIESVFKKHGKVLRCEVKNKGFKIIIKLLNVIFNKSFGFGKDEEVLKICLFQGYGPVYAFIEFDDERDAEVYVINNKFKTALIFVI